MVAAEQWRSDGLNVRLLGDLSLLRGDSPLALPPSRRTRALLGFLLAADRAHSRSYLCDLLWDGSDDPRASLRWSLTKLRGLVDEGPLRRLRADREHIAFDASACDIDTQRVDCLLSRPIDALSLQDLEDAAGLLKGEFLDGLELPGCYRFHHWCMAERERYGGLRRTVLGALIGRLKAEPECALPYGRALVAADPLAESAHAALLRLLAAADRYPDAERHYAFACELLQREVAAPRGGVLDQAIHAVRRERKDSRTNVSADRQAGTAQPAARARAGGDASAAEVSPLIGRDRERDAIEQRIGDRGSVRLLLFTGEPGIGKTRLLEYFARSAEAAGRRVIRGSCFEAELVRPYGLWLDALRSLPTDGVSAETVQRAAPLTTGNSGENASREDLFEAADALLRELAAAQPLALVFDDLHWIDSASAALLHFLLRCQAPHSDVLIAGAARAGEVNDNAAARGLLHSLRRERALQSVEVAPLQKDDIAALLDGAALTPAQVLRQSGGNPLYVLELARAAREGVEAVADSLHALIEERLDALDPPERELLTWIAAIGREVTAELIAQVLSVPLPQVLARLERTEGRGLIVPCDDGHFAFAHDMMREGVYRSLSQPRRRAIHRQIAHVLSARSSQDPSAHGEIANHAALAGEHLMAAQACMAAAQHALRVFANAQAAEITDRGLSHVDHLVAGVERVELEIALLRLRVAAATSPASRAALPALMARMTGAITAAGLLARHSATAAGWEALAFLHQQSGDVPRAQEATLMAQRATQRADSVTHCQQLANSGRCLIEIEADPIRGRALLDEADVLAGRLELEVMELEWGRGLLARAQGDLDSAQEALMRAIDLATRADVQWRRHECMVWLATVEFERGRFADVQRLAGDIVAAARRMGETGSPFPEGLDALARLRQGDERAEETLRSSLSALRAIDDKAHLAYLLNEAAAWALAAGRFQIAIECCEEALQAAQAVRRATEIDVARAQLAIAHCNVDEARCAGSQLSAADVSTARARSALDSARRVVTARIPTQAD